ncbi:MAG: hypothetical protein U9R64_08915 [Pseudomonadota bacterium]|nr:hypothetical protein [Pseudomonadota bacterium]
MNEVDVAALKTMAQGNGEVRVSKRLLRRLLADMPASEAAGRTPAMVGRMTGTVAA